MKPFDFDTVLRTCFSEAQIARLGALTVGLAGCGGLGSNCAIALVRSGFRRFILADFDVVEVGNLNRQAYTHHHLLRPKAACLLDVLLAINPAADITVSPTMLTAETSRSLFAGCDIVIEAFDRPEAKAMLAQVFLPSQKLYITASGLAGYGCSDRIRVRQIGPSAYLVGDQQTGVGNGTFPYAPCVQVAAAKQADIALTWALGGKICE